MVTTARTFCIGDIERFSRHHWRKSLDDKRCMIIRNKGKSGSSPWLFSSLFMPPSAQPIYMISEHWFELNLVAGRLKSLPAMRETWVQSLGWEVPLEKGMATHSSILAWRIPWTEEPGGLQSMGSQRVRHDWATLLTYFSTLFSVPTFSSLFLLEYNYFAMLC